MTNKIIKDLHSFFIKSWKSSAIGVVMMIITYKYHLGMMDTREYLEAIGFFVGLLGFIVKDGNKTNAQNHDSI